MSHTNKKPDTLLKLNEVLKLVRLSSSPWYKRVKTGKAPAPVKQGRSVAWYESEINQYIKELPRATYPNSRPTPEASHGAEVNT